MNISGISLRRGVARRFILDRNLYALMLLSTVPFWIVGLLTPWQAGVIVVLAFTRVPAEYLPRLVAFSWISVGLVQFAASLLAGVWREQAMVGATQLFSFGVFGWIMAGLAVWAGAAHGLSSQRIVRSVALLGVTIIPLALIGGVGVMLGFPHLYSINTIPMLLAPNSETALLYGSTTIYLSEETLGDLRTRLVLFYPYTTALGLGGIGITLISLLEKDRLIRLAGMSGGVIAVVFSWSRLALAAMLLCALGWIWFKSPLWLRLAAVFITLIALFVMSIADIDWLGALVSVQDRIDGVRAGSSLARHLIYEKSWAGFLESPIFGNGWIGPSVHPKEMLPIGSHSTVYGLLYTGGLVTFGAFAVAIAVTVIASLVRLATATGDRRDEAIVLLLLSLTLLFFCKYESLFSITLPCSYIFAFMGGALASTKTAERVRLPTTS